MKTVDVDAFRARLNNERQRLLRLPRAEWTPVTHGRCSGLKLALSMLDEYTVTEDK